MIPPDSVHSATTLDTPDTAPALPRPALGPRWAAGPDTLSAGARVLWRYRVVLAGLVALALAVMGEALLRGGTGLGAAQGEVGTRLVQAAVLLVGLVAWVREGLRLPLPGRATPRQPDAPGDPPGTAAGRRRVLLAGAADKAAHVSPLAEAAPGGVWGRLAAARARLGWAGTALGLGLTVALAGWLTLILRADFTDARAPWLWVVGLTVLVLTFVGVGAWPGGASLMPHDPTESEREPRMTRGEWLLLGVILLVAIVTRTWDLSHTPTGPYSDEGERAIDSRHLNRGEPVNQEPFIFFGTGWWGVPSIYFWGMAQALKVFGDNIFGARMFHVLAGLGTVWYTYRLGRVAWSPRAGLLAAALITVSDFAIQFSRTAGESTITQFTWIACFYYLYKALKTRRPLDWVWSGLMGGASLLGYASGKLLPPFLAVAALYLLVRWGWRGLRQYAPGLALMALAALLVYGPNGLYVLAHPDAFSARSNSVAIFADAYRAQYFGLAPTPLHVVDVLIQQFILSFRAFDVGMELGPFYPTSAPILPVLWAALWILGVAYMVWRLGDVRFALLGIWLLGGLAGAALTNSTPTLQRVTVMVPLLALIPAVYLDRVAGGAPPLRWHVPWPSRPAALQGAMHALLAALVVLLGLQTLFYYFVPYRAAAVYQEQSLVGRYAEALDPHKDRVYELAAPGQFWWNGAGLFLADRVQGSDLGNAAEDLPITNEGGKTLHFVVLDNYSDYLPILQQYYPGGTLKPILHADGSPYGMVYRVGQAQINARRQARARYGPPVGPLFERAEPRLGTLSAPGDTTSAILLPPWITYPTAVQWNAGLLAPAYGTYRLNLVAPAGATLTVDGQVLLTVPADGSASGAEARVVLARGVHQVRLAGTLASATTDIALRWGTDNGALVPIARPYLWDGPAGALLGEAYNATPPGLFTDTTPATTGLVPEIARRDSLLAWRSLNATLRGGTYVSAVWRGALRITEPGHYLFNAQLDGSVSLWIDGRLVGGRNVPNVAVTLPAEVDLAAGDHPLEIRIQATQDNARFELFWQPPGAASATLLPPAALAPVPGGAWPAGERPDVPSLDAGLLGASAPEVRATQVGLISGEKSLHEARGLAVLPDGRLVVGDTGNGRIVVYSAAGQQVNTWGTPGTGDGQFGLIADVATSADGQIAVLDAEPGDIQVFTAEGHFVTRLTHEVTGIAHASGLAWAPDGSLWVADTGGGRVLHLGRDGTPLGAFRASSNGVAPIDQPTDVVVTPGGVVYAVDLRGRVVRLNADGVADREWAMPAGTQRGGDHLALWFNTIAVSNPDDGLIRFLDLDAGMVRPYASSGTAPATFQFPVGLATGPDNRLYVLESGQDRIVILAQAP